MEIEYIKKKKKLRIVFAQADIGKILLKKILKNKFT